MSDRVESHVRTNRARWNEISDDYQRFNAPRIRGQAFTGEIAWGLWGLPESELDIFGDVTGLDMLEMGCGGSQWSTALARRGANVVGLDLSERQLGHSLKLQEETGLTFPLVQASAEEVPFADRSFHVVFADHGAFSFSDPLRAVPEAARVLRPGGLLAFSHISPLYEVTVEPGRDRAGQKIVRDYFGLHLFTDVDGLVSANLPYSGWVRLFGSCGLVIEDLLETRPKEDPTLTGRQREDNEWARRWPSECIWRLRKTAG